MTLSDTTLVSGASIVLTLFGREAIVQLIGRFMKPKPEAVATNGASGEKDVSFWEKRIGEVTSRAVRDELDRGVMPVLTDIRDGILRLVTLHEAGRG